MCGIVGFFTNNKTEKQLDLLYTLMRESSVRGLHAFGISFYKDGTLITRKSFKFPHYRQATKFSGNVLIFHNRYSTSGDWQDMNNNQPIITGHRAIAVNGVLSMKPQKEYEQEFGVECHTENDAEIFGRLLQRGVPPIIALKGLEGASFACVFLHIGKLYVLRNNKRPLYWFQQHGAVYVVSTMDIADRALGHKEHIHVVPAYQLLQLGEHA